MLTLSEIKKVHIEITTRCQARCPMCPRNYRGTDYNSGYPLVELLADDIEKILSPIKDQLTHVSFNGNLGDFSSAKEGKEAALWLAKHTEAEISIITNGSARTPQWWQELVHPRISITWDLDGLADTHSLYRIGTDFNKTLANATGFIEAGGRAIWQMIPFKHNEHQIDECKQMAQHLGFEGFWLTDHGRNQGPVYNRDGTFAYWIGEPFPGNPPPISAMIQNHESWYNKLDKSTVSASCITCHAKRSKEIYLAADGSIYPCCYLGFYPSTMSHPGNDQTKLLAQNNNAREHGIENAIKWFESVEETWSKPSVADGMLFTCAQTCGRN